MSSYLLYTEYLVDYSIFMYHTTLLLSFFIHKYMYMFLFISFSSVVLVLVCCKSVLCEFTVTAQETEVKLLVLVKSDSDSKLIIKKIEPKRLLESNQPRQSVW